ncbi:DUF262 domain-containing protein [Pedobacter roseus]|uniref:DUF262 domain-containing protein n=1 Tax=Pedobacter roseus TaxID=336820 RepID=A0A7G9QJX3_9SPHI|nr:DUF262 domain-containing protein [Pedobacter roseus]QNN43648.1 DUF262 domain-containing protein [Pedobacter roseus]
MKTGKYSLRDLLTHNEIDQMVIPELQRDYVWTTNEVGKVWNSFYAKFKAVSNTSLSILENNVPIGSSSVVTYLEKTYRVLTHKTKMGFVYAYHDKEMPGKFFLIDGQQRLTTFYLVLLAIYVKIGEADKFRKNYYSNGLPKIDYKVRESAYEFLRLFLDETLEIKDFEVNKNFFNTDYNNDTTVRNLIQNYRFISFKLKEIEKENLMGLLDYIENYIEFNYFDTKLSEQGESLYLYMNSRGFHLSHQEKLRANLIEKCNREDKKAAGKLWEEWQDFFFEHKYNNENADIGFENFLYYSSILKQQFRGKLSKEILEDFKELKEFQIQYLDIEFLKRSFFSLKAILFWVDGEKIYVDDYFSKGDKKHLFRYLTVWYYHLKFSITGIADDDLNQFRLFTLNFSHSREVQNEPTAWLIEQLRYIDQLQSSSLIESVFVDDKIFDQHDFDKIGLIGKNKSFYHFIHHLCFDYKIQELLEGRTDILFKLADLTLVDNFDNCKSLKVIEILKEIFFVVNEGELNLNLRSKLLRKYVLSYFDYGDHSGYSYGRMKINLISDNRSWLNRVINKDRFKTIIDEWLSNENYTLSNQFKQRKELFKDEFDWRYYFVNYKNVLEHTNENYFVGNGELADTILMNKTKQSTLDCYLPICLLKNLDLDGIKFKQHLLETAYLDLVVAENEVVEAFWPKPRLGLDLIYKTKGQWHLDVFYKDCEIDSMLNGSTLVGFELQENGRWRNKFFFKHSDRISLKESLTTLVSVVRKIVTELKVNGLIPTKV